MKPLRRFQATLLVLLCALASACATTGTNPSSASPQAEAIVADASVAPSEPGSDAIATVEAPADTATPASDADAMQAMPAQDTGTDTAASADADAETDFAAIYGNAGAGSAAPGIAPAAAYDPWEKYNRRVHRFNNLIDRRIATPLAHAYVHVVPRPVRLGVSNFFLNLGQPVNALNSLLQGRPKEAGQSLARFLVNTTLGIGGIFDPASDAHLGYVNEDFGQTLGKWGWKRSRYVELPLFGPRTVRDVFGLVGDAPLSPIRQVEDDPTRVFLQGLQLVDVRTQLFAVDSMREGATDDYALVRDGWTQRRRYQIFGDTKAQDESLPEYLQDDDSNPSVPADAMPVMPAGGN